jgi:hypothetical protein
VLPCEMRSNGGVREKCLADKHWSYKPRSNKRKHLTTLWRSWSLIGYGGNFAYRGSVAAAETGLKIPTETDSRS